VKMGAMSLSYVGSVTVVEQDPEAHRPVLQVKSREAGGQGHTNADVTITLSDGGGTIHTAARITGNAASMGEGVVQNVLDALISRFTETLGGLHLESFVQVRAAWCPAVRPADVSHSATEPA
jgi:carbon monoxide dehydrogenase subunit G